LATCGEKNLGIENENTRMNDKHFDMFSNSILKHFFARQLVRATREWVENLSVELGAHKATWKNAERF